LIPSDPHRFVARKKFRFDSRRTASRHQIAFNDDFISGYLEGDGKIEEPAGERIIQSHTLRHSLSDSQIITEFGGEEQTETTLRDICSVMRIERKIRGRKDIFLHTGANNILYIKDQYDIHRVILLFKFKYWYIDACPLNACVREKGSRVFTLAYS
jgi:hypothetical protein